MDQDFKAGLNRLFRSQRFGVLATLMGNQPHLSLVAFASTDDLKTIVFATSTNSKKYANIMDTPKIAMMIDNHTNRSSDIKQAIAVTAYGEARDMRDRQQKDHYQKLYTEKHPYLSEFVSSPESALIRMIVARYQRVSQFQKIHVVDL
jgi:nitroimidazol reductase NimA-like FMN-containing flavoprotein (pyridoxamine 5'-phosphate oxidase superfamily)